jgi:hypothetical protein
MLTAELKQKLIDRITETKDENLLLEIYRLMDIENDETMPYPLSDEQISVVRESQEQVKSGKFLTQKEADKELTS